jgi:hypothetical protein
MPRRCARGICAPTRRARRSARDRDYRRDLVRELGRATIEEAQHAAPERRRAPRVALEVNGRRHEGEAEPRMLLTDFLRHRLGLTGTHVGCEHGVCGACTVQIDGAPARACLTLAVQADGASIRTVEGSRRSPAALGAAGGVPPPSRAAMRLLHRRHPDVARLVLRERRSERSRAARIL